jgi:hypothetical protein
MRADPRMVLRFAAQVEDWPMLLPHYRWVRVLADDARGHRTVEMAARRPVVAGLSIPLWWAARQTITAERIEFEHIAGITTGMRVAWTIEPGGSPDDIVVRIRHVFTPPWPVPDGLVASIVGEYFVNGVARRTLARIGELAGA